MNNLRIAAMVAAMTSALALPAVGANAADATNNGAANLDQQVPSSASQQPGSDATSGAQQNTPARANARKHPPTAAMDSATPADKATTSKSAATKHPPTTEMDRAAPDQKSPGSTSTDTSPASGSGAKTTN